MTICLNVCPWGNMQAVSSTLVLAGRVMTLHGCTRQWQVAVSRGELAGVGGQTVSRVHGVQIWGRGGAQHQGGACCRSSARAVLGELQAGSQAALGCAAIVSCHRLPHQRQCATPGAGVVPGAQPRLCEGAVGLVVLQVCGCRDECYGCAGDDSACSSAPRTLARPPHRTLRPCASPDAQPTCTPPPCNHTPCAHAAGRSSLRGTAGGREGGWRVG